MTIQYDIDAICIFDQMLHIPLCGDTFCSHMCQSDYIICAIFTRCIDYFLHTLSKKLSSRISIKIIDEFAFTILKISRCRFCKALRRSDTYKSYFFLSVSFDCIRTEYWFTSRLFNKIAGYNFCIHRFHK